MCGGEGWCAYEGQAKHVGQQPTSPNVSHLARSKAHTDRRRGGEGGEGQGLRPTGMHRARPYVWLQQARRAHKFGQGVQGQQLAFDFKAPRLGGGDIADKEHQLHGPLFRA